MPDSTIAVVDGAFRFEPSVVLEILRSRWPESTFVGATGRLAEVSSGQITVFEREDPIALAVQPAQPARVAHRRASQHDSQADLPAGYLKYRSSILEAPCISTRT